MASQVDVVIVGAGAAGLSAAKSAASHGLSFVLVEASHRIGGRAHTEEFVPGQPIDRGCHWMHSASLNPFVGIAQRLGFRYRRECGWNSTIHHYGAFLDDEQARGRTALITVSTNMLVSGRIVFEPELPSWKTTAAQELPLGVHNKIAILLNNASAVIPDSQYLTAMTREHDVPVALNVRPYGYDYVVGSTAGRFAAWLERSGQAASVEFLVEHLKAVFGSGISNCLTDRVVVTTWQGDPWTLGSYSAARPGRIVGRMSAA